MNGAEQLPLDLEEGRGGLADNVIPQDVEDQHFHPSYHQEEDEDEDSSSEGDIDNLDDGNNKNGNNFDPAIVLQLLPSLFNMTRSPIDMRGTFLVHYIPRNLRTIIASMFDLYYHRISRNE